MINKLFKFLLVPILVFIGLLVAACGPAANSDSNQTTESGLEYIVVEEGTGVQPQPGDIVSVHYTGTLEDGTQFDSSIERGTPFTFTLGQGQVIAGWDEGIALMNEGGKAQLIIPPELGYGPNGSGPIPPNSTLIFDVELVEVVPAPKPAEVNDSDYTVTDSGLKYFALEEGSGATPQDGDTLSLHYRLWLEDGTLIDSSVERGAPLDIVLESGSLIPGFEEGVKLMQIGGKAQIVIPPELGYGPEGGGPIPPNTNLIFEIELLDASSE